MTQQQKALARSGAVVGALLAAGLLVLVVARDLDTADRVASLVGAIVGLAGLGVSVYALKRLAPRPVAGPAAIAGGVRSVAVAGSISGDVSTGDHHFTVRGSGRRQTGGRASVAPCCRDRTGRRGSIGRHRRERLWSCLHRGRQHRY